MILQIQTGDIRQPVVVTPRARSVVVRSDTGEPVAVFVQLQGNAILARTAADSDFEQALLELGFDKASIPKVDRKTVPGIG